MTWIPPRRTTSTPTTITVSSGSLPAWIPAPGYFNDILRTNGTLHNPFSIEADVYAEGGGPSPYPGLFYGPSGLFESIWNAQCGGCYAPLLGANGSILLFGGGHYTNVGSNVLRLDLATGLWSNFIYPVYASTEHSISGGTVATLTGTVNSTRSLDSDTVRDRVGMIGHYIKTSDGVDIPGTEVTGNSTTNWIPWPVHTNTGLAYLPPDAGGGTLGSMIFAGHDQTGINVDPTVPLSFALWRLDLETKVWTPWRHTHAEFYSFPGLEYDSHNKLMWLIRVSGSAVAFNYLTGTYHQPSGTNVNYSASAALGVTYMPSRKLMVYSVYSSADGGRAVLGAWSVANYTFGVTSSLTTFPIINNQDFATEWPAARTLYHPTARINDRLEYCENGDYLWILERPASAPKQGTPQSQNTTIKLWKLIPPPVGQEATGEWLWQSEIIADGTVGSTGAGFYSNDEKPHLGGKSRYVHALKCIVMTDRPEVPPQAIRSASWT